MFIYPLLSGEARAEKRQKALVGAEPDARAARAAAAPRQARREKVAQSLKEIEASSRKRASVTLETTHRAGRADLDKQQFYIVSLARVGLARRSLLLLLTASPIARRSAGVFVGALRPAALDPRRSCASGA